MKMSIVKLASLIFGLTVFVSCKTNAQSNGNQTSNKQRPDGDRKGPPPTTDQIFEMMDADKNNLLEESEIKGPLKKDFSAIDTDKDGFISKEELTAAPKPERKERPGGGR